MSSRTIVRDLLQMTVVQQAEAEGFSLETRIF